MALAGILVLEFAGLAPVPMAGMMLAHMGAAVVRVDRCDAKGKPGANPDTLVDGKQSIALDLRNAGAINLLLEHIVPRCDVVLDPFRPGVLERLGLGPKALGASRPGVILARLTGFGQFGPLSKRAGHDLTYLAITGALHALRGSATSPRPHPPKPPVNLLGDFAGGSLFCVLGVLAALLQRRQNLSADGSAVVVDAAMSDCVPYLCRFLVDASGIGGAPAFCDGEPGSSLLDGGAPFYDCYVTADAGGYLAIGALEAQFWRQAVAGLVRGVRGRSQRGAATLGGEEAAILAAADELEKSDPGRLPSQWPRLRQLLTTVCGALTRAQWAAEFEKEDVQDACVEPVLSFAEAATHPHHASRGVFEQGRVPLPPRALRPGVEARASPAAGSPARRCGAAPTLVGGAHSREVLRSLCGMPAGEVDELVRRGVVGVRGPKARL